VGRIDDLPLLTFTSPHSSVEVVHTAPAPAYLAMLAAGLRESRAWSDQDVAAYLSAILPVEG